jgi:indole-3-glycerol phosphate synthase
MTNALQEILAYKREEIAARKRVKPWRVIEAEAHAQVRWLRFHDALEKSRHRPALIAEIKKASPSRGLIRADFDPVALAKAYAEGGATCLSVLTDAPSFRGSEAHLAAVADVPRPALPILRKDFMIDPWQVAESRALGADCILVIMAAVDDARAIDLHDAAREYEMDALVEVHNEAELERALGIVEAHLIGINNRDLSTFETTLETTERLARLVPSDRLLVSESGIFTPADMRRVAAAGARAALVGESLMREQDVAAATRALIDPGFA